MLKVACARSNMPLTSCTLMNHGHDELRRFVARRSGIRAGLGRVEPARSCGVRVSCHSGLLYDFGTGAAKLRGIAVRHCSVSGRACGSVERLSCGRESALFSLTDEESYQR